MNARSKAKLSGPNLTATTPLRDRVYTSIRRDISLGRLEPGGVLTEQLLAERLGVSRTPIREVLLALAQDGFLHRAGRSFVVPTFTYRDLAEIRELRLLLELPAIRSTCEAIDDHALGRLAECLAMQENAHKAGDWQSFAIANERFHKTLRAQISSNRLREAIALYNDQMQALHVQLRVARWREYVLANLNRLLEAFRGRNCAVAEVVWRDHIHAAERSGREWLDARES